MQVAASDVTHSKHTVLGQAAMGQLDWNETALWKELDSRSDGTNRNTWLEAALPDVQTLLAKAATSPLNFTLHDDEHSFRVAQRIYELIPVETLPQLSNMEISLLLGAAYLHDIGMNPKRQVVIDIKNFLLLGDGNLAKTEQQRLREWLDRNYPDEQIPLPETEDQKQRLNRAEFLTAYYCRHRHNDWSGEHIESVSRQLSAPPYAGFCDDLITLCKSHHFGFEELKAPKLDAKVVGARSETVNLRYLAALLRVADVLEFDPERTPEVIFDHRSIDESSISYWQKDKYISLKLDKEGHALFYTARTESARIHKALLETADDVDRELQNCATFDKSNAFKVGATGCSLNHYTWPWQSNLVRDVAPREGTFEYIEGAFRPDSKRLLSLLTGTQLYGSPFAAIRELLQNAFDAVKEHIARELLHDRDEGNVTSTFEQRGKLHSVKLKIENRENETWFICSDTGAGMTRRVIENYLLVSGSRPRPEVVELRRSAKILGIDFERSGQFGIGALSYFMIADRVEIETSPSSFAYQDAEGHGWSFATEGVGHFGELKAITRKNRGSTISLRLRHEFESHFAVQSLKDIVFNLVSRAPCRITVDNNGLSEQFAPGW
jgi:Histidine kinase-, DNA gyrase B-, and HSP90-like ATPase